MATFRNLVLRYEAAARRTKRWRISEKSSSERLKMSVAYIWVTIHLDLSVYHRLQRPLGPLLSLDLEHFLLEGQLNLVHFYTGSIRIVTVLSNLRRFKTFFNGPPCQSITSIRLSSGFGKLSYKMRIVPISDRCW